MATTTLCHSFSSFVSCRVVHTQKVLEKSLTVHTHHAGLCHMYVHLSEMAADPGKALDACRPLRDQFPDAGHLIHMVRILSTFLDGSIRWK